MCDTIYIAGEKRMFSIQFYLGPEHDAGYFRLSSHKAIKQIKCQEDLDIILDQRCRKIKHGQKSPYLHNENGAFLTGPS
jgi:hypothetical protein